MLSGDRAESHTHDRVGTGREDDSILPSCTKAPDSSLMSWLNAKPHTFTLTNPVALHRTHLIWPAIELVDAGQANSSAYCVMPK